MIKRQIIECFRCQTPGDASGIDCARCGRGLALALKERQAIAFLMRRSSIAAIAGVALSAFISEVSLTGFAGKKKTLLVSSIFNLCVSQLIWLMADWFRPTRVINQSRLSRFHTRADLRVLFTPLQITNIR